MTSDLLGGLEERSFRYNASAMRKPYAPVLVTILALGVLFVCLLNLVALEGFRGTVERIGAASITAAPAFLLAWLLARKLRTGSN